MLFGKCGIGTMSEFLSLRRHNPDQVLRVLAQCDLSRFTRRPSEFQSRMCGKTVGVARVLLKTRLHQQNQVDQSKQLGSGSRQHHTLPSHIDMNAHDPLAGRFCSAVAAALGGGDFASTGRGTTILAAQPSLTNRLSNTPSKLSRSYCKSPWPYTSEHFMPNFACSPRITVAPACN